MLKPYPNIKPYKCHHFIVENKHKLYIEESGNPDGIPILFLHDGPGRGCNNYSRRFCNPNLFRIVCFDQRGCGRSTPYGDIENNTTQNLIDDINCILGYLKIGRCVLLGDGWGGTLALLYTIQNPSKILAIISSGTLLARKTDINWLFKNGTRHIFPDHWKKFVHNLTTQERKNPLEAYYEKLKKEDNELERMHFSHTWEEWITQSSTLRPLQNQETLSQQSCYILALAKISCHFYINNFFIEDQYILKNIDSINHIPGILIHGRYDMISPVENTYTLYEAWISSEINIIRDAGHLNIEAGIQDALVRSTNTIGSRLKAGFNSEESS